ncbi:hypothetical protein [Magnetofaba australis]|uniref:hypothetical protein n=1 Tax=Magnetofaba australis TaxID=1472297 RepID=UPI00117DF7BD|nr:hypothetical protein [Magnetofaba australis]
MVRLPALMLILALCVGLFGVQAFADVHSDSVKLETPKGDACIRDTAWMKRNHMNLLMHKRVETVREGVRMPSESLLQCQQCHEHRAQFCDKCHAYVAVKPNCFSCHVYPE